LRLQGGSPGDRYFQGAEFYTARAACRKKLNKTPQLARFLAQMTNSLVKSAQNTPSRAQATRYPGAISADEKSFTKMDVPSIARIVNRYWPANVGSD
jgi:hypothetical protein